MDESSNHTDVSISNDLIAENAYWIKLLTFINHCGREILLRILHGKRGLPEEPKELFKRLTQAKKNLQKLRNNNIINDSQWALLFPSTKETDSRIFDITLLKIMIRNFTHLDITSRYWDKNNVNFQNEKKMEEVCTKRNNKIIIYIVLLVEKRNQLMHPSKKISLYEFNIIWNQTVTILDNLDYRSREDKKVIQELYDYPLDKQGKYTAVILQSQIDVLYSMAMKIQESEGKLKQSQTEDRVLLNQLKEYMDTSKLRAVELKPELEKLQRSASTRRQSFKNLSASINKSYNKLSKVSSFVENTKEAMKEHQVPADAINLLQEQYNDLKEMISMSTDSHNRKISQLSDTITVLSNDVKDISGSLHSLDTSDTFDVNSRNMSDAKKYETWPRKRVILSESQASDNFVDIDFHTAACLIKNIKKLVLRCEENNSFDMSINKLELKQRELTIQDINLLVANFKSENQENKLQHFDASSCNLSDKQINQLADIIPFIATVILRNNPAITTEGWDSVVFHFMNNRSSSLLEHLDLRDNNLSDAKLTTLSYIVPYIAQVKLTNNRHVSESTWQTIVDEIYRSKHKLRLKNMHIYGAPFGRSQIKHVLSLVKKVKHLYLGTNTLNEDTLYYLLQYLKLIPKPWTKFGVKIEILEFKNCKISLDDLHVVNLLIEVEKEMNFHKAGETQSICDKEFLHYEIDDDGKIDWNLLNLENYNELQTELVEELYYIFNCIKRKDSNANWKSVEYI